MAKLIGSVTPPIEYNWRAPDLMVENKRYQDGLDAWLKETANTYRGHHNGDMVGELVRFQIADGFALYMVIKQRPLTVVHINAGDGWHAHAATIRGLNLADVRQQAKRNRFLAKRF